MDLRTELIEGFTLVYKQPACRDRVSTGHGFYIIFFPQTLQIDTSDLLFVEPIVTNI